jgi:hypothetical protein
MRFGQQMNSIEIQRELGVSSKRLEKIVTSAYAQVEEALTARDGESESPWRRRQRSILVACEAGLASARQRREAARLVREDPACRAMLAEIRSTLEGVAAVLPLPLLAADGRLGRFAHVRLDLSERFAAWRDQVAEFASRIVPHGSSVEQAGAGGAASVGGGLAVKAALTCVALTGTTVVCLTSGVLDTPKPRTPKPARASKPSTKTVATPSVPIEVAHVTQPVRIKISTTARSARVTKAAAAPPPSPAPPSSTEFGPGTVGSTSASATPAAAPDTGSGEFTP